MFNVIHARKIIVDKAKGWGGIADVAAHNSRENYYDENLSRLVDETGNEVPVPDYLNPDFCKDENLKAMQLTNQQEQLSSEVVKKREKLIKNLKRKPQKNAAEAIEFNISASPEFKGDWLAYFGEAEKFLRKKYGEYCVQFAVHTDESTPHMHCLFVPIVRNKDGTEKYSSSEFLGGREGLRQLQTEFWEQVGKKFELERGVEGSRARHGGAKEFRQKQQQLKKDYEILKSEQVKLAKEKSDFADKKNKWYDEKFAKDAAQKAKEEELTRLQKTLIDERTVLSERSRKLREDETSLNARTAEFEASEAAFDVEKKEFYRKVEFDSNATKVAAKMILEGNYTEQTSPKTLLGVLKGIAKNYQQLVSEFLKAPLEKLEEKCRQARESGCKNLLECVNREVKQQQKPKKRLEADKNIGFYR